MHEMIDVQPRISDNKAELDIDMIHGFLHEHAPWSAGISQEVVEQSIAGSWCFGVYLGEEQVAFARLVTDMATFGWLCDVFVQPQYRGRGYARLLMSHIASASQVKGLRRVVLVTSDAHGVYEPHGFTALAAPGRYMEIHRPDVYRAQA